MSVVLGSDFLDILYGVSRTVLKLPCFVEKSSFLERERGFGQVTVSTGVDLRQLVSKTLMLSGFHRCMEKTSVKTLSVSLTGKSRKKKTWNYRLRVRLSGPIKQGDREEVAELRRAGGPHGEEVIKDDMVHTENCFYLTK